MKERTFVWILGIICLLGVVLRFYKITNPIADWHSWRQVDTAAVARNFLKFGVDPLRPRYDDLSNIQSGKDNPEGWRMVEFPLYQLLGITIYKIYPHFSIEIALRIVTILASSITVVLLGILGKKIANYFVGIGAALFFAIIPYSVYYGRSILPEPFMVFLSLSSLTLAMVSKDKKTKIKVGFLVISAFFAGLALLVKPFSAFLLLPLPYLFLISLGITWQGIIVSTVSFLIAVIPLFMWRRWIINFPEGIPAYTWLLNEGNIRFKGAWFQWLFAERIAKLILGYWSVGFVTLGVVKKTERKHEWFLWLLLLGGLLYLSIVARGNVQHDYYQIPLLPLIALLVGKGGEFFIHPPKDWHRFISWSFGTVIILFSLAFSWYEIRGFYWINRPEIVEAGKTADTLLPKNAKVIAPYNGDTTFLYQTNRQGWPIGFEIDKKIKQGAEYYITVSPTDSDGETKDLAERYTILVRNDRFAIIDLTKPK